MGWAYIIYLQKGTGIFDIPNFVASYSDQSMQEGSQTIVIRMSIFSFETISNISEELTKDIHLKDQVNMILSHVGVITSITEAQNVTIQQVVTIYNIL